MKKQHLVGDTLLAEDIILFIYNPAKAFHASGFHIVFIAE